ncbi:endonuclease-reverse transcriptase, partial [Elysia marginata]
MVSNLDGPPIIAAEVEYALKKMKSAKAPGLDNISTEMLKAVGNFGIEKLTDIFNDIYNSGHLPEDLLQSVFITLPKKTRAVECGDFRTISLMSNVTKLLLKVLLERMKRKIKYEISDEQFGFRPKLGTREGIFCLNTIMQKFDRVHHTEMIRILKKIGIDGKDIRIIAHLYWYQKAAIRSGCDISDLTSIKRGVRQGCVLAPYLFNIYTEFFFRETNKYHGLNIGSRKFNNIRYADDTVLLTENAEDLQLLAEAVNKHSNDAGLEMNVKKTKRVVITKFPPKAKSIKIKGESIEQVSSFKYLGQEVNDLNNQDDELKKSINLAKLKFVEMKSIFKSKEIKLQKKLRLANCYIYSILLYGADTWTLPQSKLKNIEAFEMWIYRRLAKISWKNKKTNQE